MSSWDHTSNKEFYNYYAEASRSPETLARFRSIRDSVLRLAAQNGMTGRIFEVADIGCGAGTQSLVWTELAHKVHGVDINRPLLELARQRADREGHAIDFQIGSATQLPWADESMDICLLIELLEHVSEWEPCLDECARILRPKGILVLTTSNKLCPVQEEFNLPLYSWYPAALKRYFERLSMTTRPDLANYAKYPAVNWFSFYSLRAELSERGFRSMDRFDVMDLQNKKSLARGLVHSIRNFPLLRWLGHVATPGTMVLAIKH
jgi:ubiquinone/menaquinone biosynthesis C-methylase UbiE